MRAQIHNRPGGRSLVFGLLVAAAGCQFEAAVAASAPNILFVVSDDQRPDTIRALGNPTIQTPNLDRLVARGSVFSRAIAAYPVCYASRAEMLTGCSSFRAYPSYPVGSIDPKLATLAGTFQKAGYTTCYTGKWHNDGHPKQRGYALTSGLFSSGGAKGVEGVKVDSQGHLVTGYSGWSFKTDDGRVEIEKGVGLTPRTSEHIAEGAIAFIKQQRGQPFLLHVNFAAPHDPRLMPPGCEGKYDPAKMPLPGNFAPEHPFDHGNINGRDEQLLAKPLDPDDLRRELACYYAVISHMDEQLGRIFRALEATGQMENTIIIFTTDQGLALGSHGLLGKQNMYEHTVAVPLILVGPGVPAGKRFTAQCYLRDLFPTCCQLAGLPVPDTVQGKSMLPVLQGESDYIHKFVVAYFADSQRMIRDERWKLAIYPKAGRQQLFDLKSDPLELRDLSAEASHSEPLLDMRAKLTDWLSDQHDNVLK